MRQTQLSVTCFLKFQESYLFVHRTKRVGKVDGNRLNGIGGKLEAGENYLHAALRETFEETGYQVASQDCHFAGMIQLAGGYEKDWVLAVFVLDVPSLTIPTGSENDEGQLLWLHKDELHTAGYELVDDLNYVWQYITNPALEPFFAAATVSEQEKIEKIQVTR